MNYRRQTEVFLFLLKFNSVSACYFGMTSKIEDYREGKLNYSLQAKAFLDLANIVKMYFELILVESIYFVISSSTSPL